VKGRYFRLKLIRSMEVDVVGALRWGRETRRVFGFFNGNNGHFKRGMAARLVLVDASLSNTA
jgi:hypothetical protein